jgi:hypothetical protein
MSFTKLEKIISAKAHGLAPDHFHNDFGSRTPAVEHDPNWTGFTIPEWMRINTTDDRKRYK